MNLAEYVRQVGDKQFAAAFKLKERTAAAYRRRERIPRPRVAKRIVEQTPVTWAGITNNEPDAAE